MGFGGFILAIQSQTTEPGPAMIGKTRERLASLSHTVETVSAMGADHADRLRGLEQTVTELLGNRQEGVGDLQERLERLERTLSSVVEEIEARIDRGNKLWRAIRARESAAEEREESEDIPNPPQHVLPFDDERSGVERVRPMYGDMAGSGEEPKPHQVVAREIAHRIAYRGLN